MIKRIPNLWKLKLKADDRDPGTLYRLFICELMLRDDHERTVEACRIIRRHGMNGINIEEWLFTFSFEVDSLMELGQMDTALRQARSRDRAYYGHCDYARLVWKEDSGSWPILKIAPLHYFLGLFETGCQILEAALEPWFRNNSTSSYNWFWQIAYVHKKPMPSYPVSLAMFYNQLGRDLRDWNGWNEFIDGFPDRFYQVLKIGKEELRNDTKLLRNVFARVRTIQKNNQPYYTSGYGGGIEDIIETPRQIRKRHNQWLKDKQQTQEVKRERSKTSRRLDERLAELFPELRGAREIR